jgi:hypothetical protein
MYVVPHMSLIAFPLQENSHVNPLGEEALRMSVRRSHNIGVPQLTSELTFGVKAD